MEGRELLLVPMQSNDADAATVGGYLRALLRRVWEEGEGFSGKRPFGNSGWEHELYRALITAGAVVGGSLDTEGYVSERGDADQVVFKAIDALFCEPVDGEIKRVTIAALRAEIERLEAKS